MLQESIKGQLNIAYKNDTIDKNDKILFFDINGNYLNYRETVKDISILKEISLSKFDKNKAIFAFGIEKVKYYIYKIIDSSDLNKFEPINKKEILHFYSEEEAYIILSAWHIFNWYQNTKFCGKCGTLLKHSIKERSKKCPNCNAVYYPQIAPAIIVRIEYKDKILVTKYANNPLATYALVAGFMEIGESPEDTVRREVMEEVGIKVKNIKYFASQPWGITGGLLLGFIADLDGDSKITIDKTELSEAHWMTIKEAQNINFTSKTLTGTLINDWISILK